VLDRRGLAVLKYVFEWRDETARRLNKPPRTILSDSLLVEVSRKPPGKVEDLNRIRGMRVDQIKGFGQGIVRAAQEGRATPDKELPQWPASRGPSKRDVLIGDMLFAVLKVIAYEEDLATELLSTRDDLQQLIKMHRENRLEEKSTALTKGWRYELAGKKLISMLEGNDLKVSIGNTDKAPIDLEFGATLK
jgi:ribonuclease D